MKRLFTKSLMLITVLIMAACQKTPSVTKIAIIVPIEHNSMNDIIDGFKQQLLKSVKTPVQFKILNAEGDMNLQRAIIEQVKAENYNLIAPIGLVATQMTARVIHKQPIVSLASSYTQLERQTLSPCNMVSVNDEISSKQILEFIHQSYPSLKRLVLIHSPSDKVFNQLPKVKAAASEFGIEVKALMVNSMSDLYTIAHSIPQDTQGIFVLKDLMVASGIGTLEQVAQARHIPLFTSDQGSVQSGAAIAIGVPEQAIGQEGAKLAAAILNGRHACDLPIVKMQRLTIFINEKSLAKEGQPLAPLQITADRLHYTVVKVGM
jgi:putative tryptophan/tyrosine transport system substrate-binding protein